MTARVPCPCCLVVLVRPGHMCFDCCYKTPQERQDGSELLREDLESARIDTRDRFAMASLTAVENWAAVTDLKDIAVLVYDFADAMLEVRKAVRKPEPP